MSNLLDKAILFFAIAYLAVGYFSFSSAQVLNESAADSLIQILITKDLSDTSKYEMAMDIADYATAPKLSLKYAQQALDVADELHYPLWQGAAWLNIGKSQRKLGNNKDALNAVINSISFYQLAESPTGVASGYLVLGEIYFRQENYSQALTYYNRSIDILRSEQDTTRLATALLNVSEVYKESLQYDLALSILQEAQQLFSKLHFDIGIAYAIGNTGIIEVLQRNYKSGEEKLLDAIKVLKQVGDNYSIASYQLSIAEIYQEQGAIDEALGYAQQSWTLAEQDGLLEQMRNASEQLASLYVAQEDYQQAYLHQTRYLELRDSINNIEVVQNMADMRTEFEVAQKQAEIDLLTERRETQRIVQLVLILVSLLIVAVAWLYYRGYRLQKKANRQLNQQKEELHTRNELLDALITTREKFISIISHDLRGPVGSFHGLANIMKMQLAERAYDSLPTVVSHMEKAALHLSMLLDNLLNWALNQQDNIPIQPERLSIKEVADEVVEVFQAMAMAKEITLHSLIHAPLYGWADRNALFTILRNLVNNALKFTPEQGQVTIEGEQEGEQLVIRIRDTGVGMSPEKVNTLFQTEEGEHTWGTSGEKGVGLGLQLVKEFVDRSHGSINVKSVPGEGTTFIVHLPVRHPEAVTS